MPKNEIKGMKELERAFRELGKVPQTTVTKAAKAGASIAWKSAKAKAPVDIGELQGGIILKAEKRTRAGKKVYDIMMNPAKNAVFVRMTKDGKRYYYPAAQEFGYMLVNGGYMPGLHFLRNSLTHNKEAIEQKVIEVALTAIDKAWGKG